MASISEVIRSALKRKELTQRQLSIYTGVDYNTLNKIVRGETQDPTIKVIAKLWRFLGLKLDGLIDIYAPLPITTTTAVFSDDNVTAERAIELVNSMKTSLLEKYGTAECGTVTNVDGYTLVETADGTRWVKEHMGKLIGYPASKEEIGELKSKGKTTTDTEK